MIFRLLATGVALACAVLMVAVVPSRAVAQAAVDIPAQFGNRLKPRAPQAQLSGDFDGDGVADTLHVVQVLPRTKQNSIANDVTISNPWSQHAPGDAAEPLALAIMQGQKKFLLHDAEFFASPIWGQSKLPMEVAKKGSAQFRKFQRQAKGIKHDILVLGTEAGIDIALYWDGKKYVLFWPEETP